MRRTPDTSKLQIPTERVVTQTHHDIGKLSTKFQDDPELFFNDYLGVDLWEKEKEIVKSIWENRKTTIRSCHGSGKTFTVARSALAFMYSFPPAVVINTAPTARQVQNQFWREFRAAHNRAKVPLGGDLLKTQFNLDEDWFAMGFSTSQGANDDFADKFQGWHGKNMLFVVDEASGVSEAILEAIDGAMSGGLIVRLVYIGNPTRRTGSFHSSFTNKGFNKIHISAFDIPNVKEKRVVVPGLTTHEWVEEMREKYGEDSDVWRVRVLGEFPIHESDTLIGIDTIERAMECDRENYGEEEALGVDPARFGTNFSAWVYRKGNFAKIVKKMQSSDLMTVAGETARMLKENKNLKAYIDIVGLGAGVYDRLKEQNDISSRVFGVNSAQPAKDKEKHKNVRIESWEAVKDWLKDANLEKSEEWYQLAQVKYKITSTGQLQLESKEDMEKRGIQSPDVADALALTLSRPTKKPFRGLTTFKD